MLNKCKQIVLPYILIKAFFTTNKKGQKNK